jgi:hypothetical protein
METHCFGKFNKEQEECAYCKVAVECYEDSSTIHHPGATKIGLELP